MFKKINIKYLVLFFIFMLLGNHIKIPKELVNILRTNTFNLIFILVLIKFNNNNLINLFIYLLFLTTIYNQGSCEGFSEVKKLKKEIVNLTKDIFDISFKKIPSIKSRIKKSDANIKKITSEIYKSGYEIDNIKSMNELNSDINIISKGRNKSIKGDLSMTKNELLNRISRIDPDIKLSTEHISQNNDKIAKINKSIAETIVKITSKKPLLPFASKNYESLNSRMSDLEEKLKEEQDSEQKATIQSQITSLKEQVEKAENKVNDLTSYIDNQTTIKEGLETDQIDLQKNTEKLNSKIKYLKELKIKIRNKVNSFNNVCDNKLNSFVNTLNKHIYDTDRDTETNNRKIASIKSQIQNKEKNIKKIEKNINEMDNELSNYIDKKDEIKNNIGDLKLKIGELENPE